MKKNKKPKIEQAVIRINKCQIDKVIAKKVYYCVDDSDKDAIKVYLIDNTKGKKEITEFDSIDELIKYLDN